MRDEHWHTQVQGETQARVQKTPLVVLQSLGDGSVPSTQVEYPVMIVRVKRVKVRSEAVLRQVFHELIFEFPQVRLSRQRCAVLGSQPRHVLVAQRGERDTCGFSGLVGGYRAFTHLSQSTRKAANPPPPRARPAARRHGSSVPALPAPLAHYRPGRRCRRIRRQKGPTLPTASMETTLALALLEITLHSHRSCQPAPTRLSAKTDLATPHQSVAAAAVR